MILREKCQFSLFLELLSTLSTSPKIAQWKDKTEKLEREIEELKERERQRATDEIQDDEEPSQLQSTLQSLTIDKQEECIKNLKYEMREKDKEWLSILERVKVLERERTGLRSRKAYFTVIKILILFRTTNANSKKYQEYDEGLTRQGR